MSGGLDAPSRHWKNIIYFYYFVLFIPQFDGSQFHLNYKTSWLNQTEISSSLTLTWFNSYISTLKRLDLHCNVIKQDPAFSRKC